MNDVNLPVTKDIIKNFEKELLKLPQIEVELTHRFLDGIYVREVFMKKGTFLTSKTHKTENFSIISKGSVIEVSEGQKVRRINAPLTFVSPSGMKRALYIIEDTVWTTVHHNPDNIKDLSILEKMIIEPEDHLKVELI